MSIHRPVTFLLSACVALSVAVAAIPAALLVYAAPPTQVTAPVCGGTISADADATVSEMLPTSPLGNERTLLVSRNGSNAQSAEALLHFTVPLDMMPAGSSIQSAEIELGLVSPVPTGPFVLNVSGVASAWSEGRVMWSTRPPARGSFGSKSYHTVPDESGAASARVDVTALVNLWASAQFTETSVYLGPGAAASEVQFSSRDGGPAVAPRLIVRCTRVAKPVPLAAGPRDLRQQAGLHRLLSASTIAKPALQLQAGALRFAELDLAIPPEAGATGVQRARWFTSAYSDALRLDSPAAQLQLLRRSQDGNHIVFRQRHNGIPVYPAELGVHSFGGRIVAVSGAYVPDITTGSTPTLSAEQAEAIVLGLVPGSAIGSESQLRYLNTGLTGGPDHETYLTWMVVLKNSGEYFIDAATGQLRLERPSVYPYDMDLETGNHASYSGSCYEWWTTWADDHLCSEGGCNSDGIADWEAGPTWWNIRNTYWWYRNNLGLDSWDNDNDEIQIYIHVGDGNGNYWPNAHFLGDGDCMEFGDGWAAAPDILTHEYTHGVIHHTSQLVYANEPGAINESFADVFGELVEDGSADWLTGEGLPNGAYLRSLSKPSLKNQPSIYQDTGWYPLSGSPNGDNDHGGVHWNSGVPNKAAYLLVHGDTFNGYTVNGIGMAKGRALLYTVMVTLPSNALMIDVRNAAVAWAKAWAKAGNTNGFHGAEICSVRNAYAAVGLGDGDDDCDGQENGVDLDDDGDLVWDVDDNCPKTPNTGQGDADGDGAGDACETDDDADLINDLDDNCPLNWNPDQANWDGGFTGDACSDNDADAIMDSVDNCVTSYNPDQLNTDGDAKGNACDENDDNDGWNDTEDNCRETYQTNQNDGDSDQVGDACDLCKGVSSSDNGDPDKDGLGNPCDPDDDNDGILDGADNCPQVPNPGQADLDNNGLGLECDEGEQNLLHHLAYPEIYTPANKGIVMPTPGGCTACGPDGLFDDDYWQQATISMDVPFYAQVVDTEGHVVGKSNSGAGLATMQTIRFQPALFAYEKTQIMPGLSLAQANVNADGIEYSLEIYPLADPPPGQNHNVVVTFDDGVGEQVYLPMIRR